jgi:hypothetical protein
MAVCGSAQGAFFNRRILNANHENTNFHHANPLANPALRGYPLAPAGLSGGSCFPAVKL